MKPIPDYLASIPTSGTEKTPPNPARTKMAFARVGYSLAEAIADLIDNSIDAKASDVLVRLLYDRNGVHRVFVADNGKGMSESVLSKAMQFGSTRRHEAKDLGQYGIGLKAASFSQAGTFSVVTNNGAEISGRRWTNKSFEHDWLCEKLAQQGCKELLSSPWGPLNPRDSGTIVVWDDLSGLRSGQSTPEETVNRAIRELSVHLGLVFHRFITKKALKIFLDTQVVGKEQNNVFQPVKELDPFSYSKPGALGYPKKFVILLEQHKKISLEAHIWPKRTKEAGYRLGGGKVAERQGFYFYRNNRLIQAGGWNGWRDENTEPHLSLARVSVELPSNIDVSIQKDKVDTLPRGFIQAVRESTSGPTPFRDYIRKAEDVYRKKGQSEADFPLVPRRGLVNALRVAARKLAGPDEKRFRSVDFRWKKMNRLKLFEIERDRRRIILNDFYRKDILGGNRRSQNDAQLFKIMLFLLLREYFDFQAMTKVRAEMLEKCNELLLRSLND